MWALATDLTIFFLSAQAFAINERETIQFDEWSVASPSSDFSCDLENFETSDFLDLGLTDLGRLYSEHYLISHKNFGCLGSFRFGETLHFLHLTTLTLSKLMAMAKDTRRY